MNEIEIGEYIRTRNGLICKILAYQEIKTFAENECAVFYNFDTDRGIVARCDILEHSTNLIDLIEEGDIVNKHLVINKKDDEGKTELGLESDIILNKYIEDNEILTIQTHEQYEQNCYHKKEEKK